VGWRYRALHAIRIPPQILPAVIVVFIVTATGAGSALGQRQPRCLGGKESQTRELLVGFAGTVNRLHFHAMEFRWIRIDDLRDSALNLE
jgi:hypothetical protein